MNQSVLVTGGLGFIGKSLSQNLLSRGYELLIVDKVVDTIPPYMSSSQIIQGDVCDIQFWNKLQPCDYVFHLAAPSSVILFNSNLDDCVHTTLSGLINAFQWSRRGGVKKLIYPSSGSIFGNETVKCSETTKPNPLNSYGKTKLACEYIAKIYENSVPNLGLRIFAGYGYQENMKNEIASVVTIFLEKMLNNESPIIFGDGNQTRDFVYIDDITDLMVNVISDNTTGLLNVGSGQSVSFNKLSKIINNTLQKNILPLYIQKPEKYLENTLCDPSLFRKILGRDLTDLKTGIEKYVNLIR